MSRPFYGSPAVAAITVVGGLLRYARVVAWLALVLPLVMLVWWSA